MAPQASSSSKSKGKRKDEGGEPFMLGGLPDPVPWPAEITTTAQASAAVDKLKAHIFGIGEAGVVQHKLVFRVHAERFSNTRASLQRGWNNGYGIDNIKRFGWVDFVVAYILSSISFLIRFSVDAFDGLGQQRGGYLQMALYLLDLRKAILEAVPAACRTTIPPSSYDAFDFQCHALDCFMARVSRKFSHDNTARMAWMKQWGLSDSYIDLWKSWGTSIILCSSIE